MENLRIPEVKLKCAKKILRSFNCVKIAIPEYRHLNPEYRHLAFNNIYDNYIVARLDSMYYSGANIYTFNFIVDRDLPKDVFFPICQMIKEQLEVELEKIQILNIVVTLRVGFAYEKNRY